MGEVLWGGPLEALLAVVGGGVRGKGSGVGRALGAARASGRRGAWGAGVGTL